MSTSCMFNDAEVRDGVLRQLSLDPRLQRSDIGVNVQQAAVTLTGAVATTDELLAALEAARRSDGVFTVVHEIRVRPVRKPRTDAEIAKALREAFKWNALAPNRHIQVAVSNGWVALQGRVDFTSEREDAERITRRFEGVRGVYNLIEVNPQPRQIDLTPAL
jgi:osmotically-inducible protein OsmY